MLIEIYNINALTQSIKLMVARRSKIAINTGIRLHLSSEADEFDFLCKKIDEFLVEACKYYDINTKECKESFNDDYTCSLCCFNCSHREYCREYKGRCKTYYDYTGRRPGVE